MPQVREGRDMVGEDQGILICRKVEDPDGQKVLQEYVLVAVFLAALRTVEWLIETLPAERRVTSFAGLTARTSDPNSPIASVAIRGPNNQRSGHRDNRSSRG
jgi:hypothetical protein